MDEQTGSADDVAYASGAEPGRGSDDAPEQVGPRAVEPAAGVPSPGVPSTGDAAVDEALTLLADLDAQPLRAHVAAFDAVHGALQDRLADAEG